MREGSRAVHFASNLERMTIAPAVLRTHIAYTAWASRRLLHAAAELTPDELTRDFGTADRSVLGTLCHIFGADRIWLARLTQAPQQGFVAESDRTLAFLETEWPALFERWTDFAGTLTEESIAAPVSYIDLKGNPWTQPLWQPILHFVNHGTHHRGQVSGFLRTMGHPPAPLDLAAYYRQHPLS